MKAREVIDSAVAWGKEHPMIVELLAAFIAGFVAGGLVFG